MNKKIGWLIIISLLLIFVVISYFFLNKEEIVKINDVRIGGYYNYSSCLSEAACSAVLIDINFSLLKEDKNNCVIFKNGTELVKHNCPTVTDSNGPNGYRLDCSSYMPSYTDWMKWTIDVSRNELMNSENIPFFEICCKSEKIRYSEQSTLDKSSFECSKSYYINHLKDLA